jgi:hypothetical protein
LEHGGRHVLDGAAVVDVVVGAAGVSDELFSLALCRLGSI